MLSYWYTHSSQLHSLCNLSSAATCCSKSKYIIRAPWPRMPKMQSLQKPVLAEWFLLEVQNSKSLTGKHHNFCFIQIYLVFNSLADHISKRLRYIDEVNLRERILAPWRSIKIRKNTVLKEVFTGYKIKGLRLGKTQSEHHLTSYAAAPAWHSSRHNEVLHY